MARVETLGSLWESTKESVEIALRETKAFNNVKEDIAINKKQLKTTIDMMDNHKDDLETLLKRAGISKSTFFPFKTRTNAEGEIEYLPKNIFKMKKDANKARKQLEEALENNKITQIQFDFLNETLNDMLKENGLDEEKEEEEEIEVTEEEVEELYATFNEGIDENVEGLMAALGEESFIKMCEEYENLDLEDRKYKLQEMNSAINIKLGIAGKLDFSTDKNLQFENSFTKNGYLLSETDVLDNGLKDMTRNMMEMAMVRKLMVKKNQTLSLEQRKALVEKIKQEKRKELMQKNQMNQKQSMSRSRTFGF